MPDHGDTALLPADVMNYLDGADLDPKIGETIILGAASDGGWPHLALLSIGEVVAPHAEELRILLRRDGRTIRALTSSGRGQLLLVLGNEVVKIYISTREGGTVIQGDPDVVIVRAAVAKTERDSVSYAEVTSGITYRLHDRSQVLRRWTAQVELLMKANA